MTVLDTSVFIDLVRGLPGAGAFLQGLDTRPVASEISRIELLQGMRSPERRQTERVMASVRWIPVDEGIARQAGEFGRAFRRSHQLEPVDLAVAATADLLGLPLATANVKHFPMFPDLRAPY